MVPAKSNSKTKTIIAWLTSVLLLVPALINAGVDVYNSIMNIPVGNLEKLNASKRSEHFQEEPLFSRSLEIEELNARKILKLFVYPNADIYVNYSGYEHWLPSQNASEGVSLLNFINTAHASDVFGTPNAIIDLKRVRKSINIESLKALKAQETAKLEPKIQRSYWFEQISSPGTGFTKKKTTFSKTFKAIEGYKIINFKLDIASQSHAKVESATLSEDNKEVRITYSVESGPIFDRWKGWIKGQIITNQKKI